jgi:YesN/AraC family two-component response regulator
MNDKSIIVVANKHLNNFYSALSTDEASVSVEPFTRSMDSIHKKSADIVLLDCGHDGVNGLEWLSKFKKMRKDAPVIFITNERSHDIVMNAYKLGVRDYFTKPVSISELNRIIKELLSLKRLSSEKRTSLPCNHDSSDHNIDCKLTNAILSDVPTGIMCAVHYIEESLSNTLSLSEIAEQANLSKYHFTRIFKSLTGFTPLEFVGILKMHKAKNLFIDENLSVSEVAEKVGYIDVRNFDRRFKQHTGLTPTMYKNSMKNSL